MTKKSNQYFAAQDSKELAQSLEQKLSEWSNFIDQNAIKSRWIKSYRLYYGRHFKGDHNFQDGSSVLSGGKDGELALVTVNHYRNFIKHVHTLTTNQKPAFDVRAINSDPKSMQQSKLGNAILDAYLREKRLGRYLKTAAEHALVFGKGFIKITWEPSLGRPHAVEIREQEDGTPTERVVYEGDVDVSCPSPFDVLVDPSQEDWNKCEWVIIRSYRNKFNLAARYPELKETIEGLPTKSDLDGKQFLSLQNLDATADTPVYEFYHKRTDAMPNGRYVLFCNGETVLYDGAIPYEKLPVFRIVPGEIFGTTEGYTDAFDLMALQDVINTLVSAAFTNQQAYAVQNVLIPEGSNISVDQLGENLAGIKYNPQAGKPEALQLTSTPAELFKLLELAERWGETLSGVNSVARGNPESSLKSGVALGLIQSMAVQFASGFQQSWAELLEDCGTFILSLLKVFAKTERMVAMAGSDQKYAIEKFSGSDLENVERAIVEVGNPLSKTGAGKFELAKFYAEQGMLKDPKDIMAVLETGRLESATDSETAQKTLISQENEDLRIGKKVQALVGDKHLKHMQEHLTVLSDPRLRGKAANGDELSTQILMEVQAHIQQHMELYSGQDQIWAAISGEPPSPMQAPPMPPQGGAPQPQAPQEEAPQVPLPENAQVMEAGMVPPPPVPMQ